MTVHKTRRMNKPHFKILGGGKIEIPLTKGKWTTISTEDLRHVIKYGWSYRRGGGNKQMEYAAANIKIDGVWMDVLLHRFLMGAPKGTFVDHMDGDGLNNCRANLRLATRNQNQANSCIRTYKGKRSSRFKGVHWDKEAHKWVAQICYKRQHYYLGVYSSEEEAARVYDKKARELQGEFCRPNFPG